MGSKDADATTMMNHYTKSEALTSNFVREHEISTDSQFKQLAEEVGELAEALNTDASTDEIAEEVGDVVFVARTLGHLEDVDVHDAELRVAAENARKNSEQDGDKVTKE